MSIRSLDLGEIGTLLYADVRDAAIAVGWGPIHVSRTRAGWRVAAGGRESVAPTPGVALVSLLVLYAAGEA